LRPDRTMPMQEALDVLRSGKYGVLSVAAADGLPYGIPVNYVFSEEDHALYFHCLTKGRKIEAMKENNRVSFVVIGSESVVPDRFITHYESVVVSGRAEILADAQEKTQWLIRICEKFAPDALARRAEVIQKYLPAVLIVKIAIDEISGKRNRDE
jgi:uncharacterized protein